MEGFLNHRYPSAKNNYDDAMARLRKEYAKPVFGFEVGQFEILPDFEELEAFQGVLDPANLRIIRERVKTRGLTGSWKKYVEASGELSRIGYREEIEAAMRTKEMSGISLLGLQDFPGQGTALVGMMNSHLQPKPYAFAKPEHFRCFFRDELPLVLLPKYTWENTERLTARVQVANFGKREIDGVLEYALTRQPKDGKGYSLSDNNEEKAAAAQAENGAQTTVIAAGSLLSVRCPAGGLTDAGTIEIALDALGLSEPVRLNLTVRIGNTSNRYPVWIYPQVHPQCPEGIYETRRLDERAKEILEAGGRVFLAPPSTKEALPFSIQAQFTTDFWSVGTFAGQEGGMGQLTEDSHPVFENFPTEFHTNWQQYPEARALLDAIYRYMDSDRFLPRQEIAARYLNGW